MTPHSRVAVAGATGFIGRSLLSPMTKDFEVVALSRSHPPSSRQAGVTWKTVDFFSVDSLTEALQGCETAVYLIHSMLPTARLDQSRFEDTDLWLADSFARAAKQAGVKSIIYLGGLVPKQSRLSLHLQSRKEIESVLGSTGIHVITLRAGLILGAEGSSFQLLYLLVKRLPMMVVPRWAHTPTQPIALEDVTQILLFCLKNTDLLNGTYDIGGENVTTYHKMMVDCAALMNKERFILRAPIFSPRLSTLWICLITGASRNLVTPLVGSLTHEMIVQDEAFFQHYTRPRLHSREAIARCLSQIKPLLRDETKKRKRARSQESEVRSIQRFKISRNMSAKDFSSQYFNWIRSLRIPFLALHLNSSQTKVDFVLKGGPLQFNLIELTVNSPASSHLVHSFRISGGILTRKPKPASQDRGTLEFRVQPNLNYGIIGLHRFSPRLPWIIYRYSQAQVHLWVMNRFRKTL